MTTKRSAAQAPAPERAMEDKELDRWLQARRAIGPLTTNLAMLDGFITALAAGPVGLDLIGALLEALALEHGALNVGGTPEFAAMKAAADRFNRIGAELTNRTIIRPHHRRRGNGDIWPADWCEGFLAAVNLNRADWKTAMDPSHPLHEKMLPILLYCQDDRGKPYLGRPQPSAETKAVYAEAWKGIPTVVAAIRHHYHFIPAGQSRRR
jgi:yecA family protein